MSATDDQGNLEKVKHIVVVMMENRSFDQMLGYLRLAGVPDVNGLTGDEFNEDAEGNRYPVFQWGQDQTSFHPTQDTTGKVLDPCHSPKCVAQQLENNNGGFVKNFLATRRDKNGRPTTVPPEFRGLPMGYYSNEHLPAYDYLAHKYCVCDAWHASIPGDTWPNRLFSLAAQAGVSITERGWLHSVIAWIKRERIPIPGISKIGNVPIYDVPAFTRQLAPDQWRWYSHDPATLRGADSRYREFAAGALNRENFAFFDRKKMGLLTDVLEGAAVELHDGFLDDAAKGQLRDVSWIDPNFIDLKILDPNSNDDHPPTDLRAGQAFILELYDALVNSRDWQDTLLVIVYDEHGGFYDHMPAPVSPFSNDNSTYATLGVRVPAIVIGPRVKNEVCHTLFEHTTLIATILRRFAADPAQALAQMPSRVAQAPHLGGLLGSEPRPEMLAVDQLNADITALRSNLDQWRTQARQNRRARSGQPASDIDGGAGWRQELHDWQEQFLGFALAMRANGLPPGQP
jgi:phospholipase C